MIKKGHSYFCGKCCVSYKSVTCYSKYYSSFSRHPRLYRDRDTSYKQTGQLTLRTVDPVSGDRRQVGYPTPSRKRKGVWSTVMWCHAHSIPMVPHPLNSHGVTPTQFPWCHAHSIPMVSRPPKGIFAHASSRIITMWLLVRQEAGRWVRVY